MKATVIVLCFVLAGCASNRYLSEKEDAELRKARESQGCAIVPVPLWEKIEGLLGVIRDI